jgi:hypothetical protein
MFAHGMVGARWSIKDGVPNLIAGIRMSYAQDEIEVILL